MNNIDLVAIDSTDLETITGGQATAKAPLGSGLGAELGRRAGQAVGETMNSGGLGRLVDSVSTIYAPPPMFPQQPAR